LDHRGAGVIGDREWRAGEGPGEFGGAGPAGVRVWGIGGSGGGVAAGGRVWGIGGVAAGGREWEVGEGLGERDHGLPFRSAAGKQGELLGERERGQLVGALPPQAAAAGDRQAGRTQGCQFATADTDVTERGWDIEFPDPAHGGDRVDRAAATHVGVATGEVGHGTRHHGGEELSS
jgi:hypothetical protein